MQYSLYDPDIMDKIKQDIDQWADTCEYDNDSFVNFVSYPDSRYMKIDIMYLPGNNQSTTLKKECLECIGAIERCIADIRSSGILYANVETCPGEFGAFYLEVHDYVLIDSERTLDLVSI